MTTTAGEQPTIHWIEEDQPRSARWRSENGNPAPKRVVIADDRMTADTAYRLACEGTGMLWRGDFQNARQLLQALARRAEPKAEKRGKPRKQPTSPTDAFNLHRQAQSQRARTLGMLLLPFNADYSIPLRRAPDVHLACNEAYGAPTEPFVASLRELLGLIGAHEWRKKGVEITALGEGGRIHPHYGVYSPVRGEYIELAAAAPLPSIKLAFDIGTGTGVLAALLAKRGVQRVVATDMDPRALTCARENLTRLDLNGQVTLVQADLFPEGRAPLVICNPPWVPARPSSPIEHAVYDPESRMLRGFLSGLAQHLEPAGEGWLILSDLAEHLGLRSRAELLAAIDAAGLQVLGKTDIRPHHPKVSDQADPLYAARAAELTSLWRLAVR
ncbi:Methylase of polypeptide chain release factors [Collimonas sp. OK307]|uniref:methyltransferase n=1 Tax=Collimonas sp. OK307 TaxID=1801620 RepID=UPI0008E0E301|nr:class I SAM-dependent methyltransferase [Collimonas sp. OK307]SFH64193.1 Methylase of polypeptide chain release factors [Collimonas sp. OK307]